MCLAQQYQNIVHFADFYVYSLSLYNNYPAFENILHLHNIVYTSAFRHFVPDLPLGLILLGYVHLSII